MPAAPHTTAVSTTTAIRTHNISRLPSDR
jgi:hypothetical protein